jgi:ankyrin repeat protein
MTDLLVCTLMKNRAKFNELVKTSDTNMTKTAYNITPLWCAITGIATKPEQPTTRGEFEMMETLLEYNADPNKVVFGQTPAYTAVFQRSHEMLAVLLSYGADPNIHSVTEEDNSDKKNICKFPLVAAAENCDVNCVNLLLKYNVFYNKKLIEAAKRAIKNFNKLTPKDEKYVVKKKNMEKIVALLEKHYSEDKEQRCNDYIQANKQSANYFMRLE